MSLPSQDLPLAYAEWRRLADAEGQAIRSGNWTLVAECQDALAALRSRIDRITHSVAAWRSNPTGSSPQAGSDLRGSVLELIELQRRNLSSLEERRRRLSQHVENLTSAGRKLRSIQRSYSSPATGGFSSYS
jgi:hypothetical protein